MSWNMPGLPIFIMWMKMAIGFIDRKLSPWTGKRVHILGVQLPFTKIGRLLGQMERISTRLKVLRCVRDGARFRIEGRLIDATRGLRTQLAEGLALLAESHPGG